MTRQEWLEWRKQGIGGSDAASIMGVSPWKTIEQLYEEKVSDEIVDNEPNYAQARGIRMEPRIRSLFEIIHGHAFEPGPFLSAEFPYLRVSLDGRNVDEPLEICEIKVSGKEDWTKSKTLNMVPSKYFPQIQHALIVSGAKVCFYLSYLWTKEEELILDREKLVIIPVFLDLDYATKYLIKCHEFWQENVMKRVPPNRLARQIGSVIVDNNKAAFAGPGDDIEKAHIQMVTEWKYLEMQITELTKRQEQVREEIVAFVKSRSEAGAVCNGVRIQPMQRKGNVDYKAIPELTGVDLEKYRKAPTQYWKMEIVK